MFWREPCSRSELCVLGCSDFFLIPVDIRSTVRIFDPCFFFLSARVILVRVLDEDSHFSHVAAAEQSGDVVEVTDDKISARSHG